MIIQLVPTAQAGNCETTACAFEAIVHAWDKNFAVSCRQLKELSTEERKAIDPLAVATFILSIPPAALAVLDLTDRIRKRQRAKQIIDKAGELCAAGNVRAYIVTVEGAIPLDAMRPDDLLDLAASLNELQEW